MLGLGPPRSRWRSMIGPALGDVATETLLQITAPHFCAGLVVEADRVVQAAPILRWMLGKPEDLVRWHCQRKGWAVTTCAR